MVLKPAAAGANTHPITVPDEPLVVLKRLGIVLPINNGSIPDEHLVVLKPVAVKIKCAYFLIVKSGMENLSEFAEQSGTTDDPRKTIANSSTADAQLKSKISKYADRDQEKMLLLISHALARRKSSNEKYEETVRETLSDPHAKEEIPKWAEDDLKKFVKIINSLAERQTDSWDLRKFDTDNDTTPQQLNDRAKDSDHSMSLMAMNAAISKTGDANIYHLPSSEEYIICQITFFESSTGITAYMGRRQGVFTATITRNPETYFEDELKPGGWRRPKDLA
jgi:hypothetical protein